MEVLTDEQVFGTGEPKEVTDEEVFGPAQRTSGSVVPEAEVFGLPATSQPGTSAEGTTPDMFDYLGEFGKKVATGAVESFIASPLKGFGAVSRGGFAARKGEIDPETGLQELKEPEGAETSSLYQAGEAASKATQEYLPDRKILNSVVGDIASGLGSVVGSAASSLIPGYGFLSIPAQGMGEAAERAVKAGATPEQQLRAAQFGTIAGATDFADIALFTMGTTGKALGLLKKVGVRALEGALLEGGQEGLQQFIQNAVAKGVYKPDQDLTEDVPYNMLIGGIVGGAVKGVMPEKLGKEDAELGDLILKKREEELVQSAAARNLMSPTVEGNSIFTSNVVRAVQKLPDQAYVEQVEQTIRQAPGVRQEELDLIKIPEYFADVVRPGGKIDKADLLDFLNENRVEIIEVNSLDTKHEYASYVTPGPAQNYQEIMLLFKDSELSAARRLRQSSWQKLQDFKELMSLEYGVDAAYEAAWKPADRAALNQLQNEDIAAFNNFAKLQEQTYTDPHFHLENVIAHLRVSERVDAQGNPFFYIEEMQSDWSEMARKYGVKGDEVTLRKAAEVAVDRRAAWPAGSIDREKSVQATMKQWRTLQPPRKMPLFNDTNDWTRLLLSRMVRMAADKGYSRIAWTTGQLAADFAAGGVVSPEIVGGLKTYYDKIVPSVAKRLAKKFGGTIGELVLERRDPSAAAHATQQDVNQWYVYNADGDWVGEYRSYDDAMDVVDRLNRKLDYTRVSYLEVPPSAFQAVQEGLPMFQKNIIDAALPPVRLGPQMMSTVNNAAQFMQKILRNMGSQTKVKIILQDEPVPGDGKAEGYANYRKISDHGEIRVHLPSIRNPEHMYTILMHEFGHIISFSHLNKSPLELQLQLSLAYSKFKQENKAPSRKLIDLMKARYPAVRAMLDPYTESYRGRTISEMTPEGLKYNIGFEEWFADNVARWATTSEKALTEVDRWFSNLARRLREMFREARRIFGAPFTPDPNLSAWLDSFITDAAPSRSATRIVASAQETQRRADQRALGDDLPAAPYQGAAHIAQGWAAATLLPGPPAPGLANQAAHANRMNWFYRYFAGLSQLVEANPLYQPLRKYWERIALMHREESRLQDAALQITRKWRDLPVKESDRFTAFMLELVNMTYRTPQEVGRGVVRQPTVPEVEALANRFNLSADARKLHTSVQNYMKEVARLIEAAAITKAMDDPVLQNDPVKLADRISQIQAKTAKSLARPYFPFMHFGDHALIVRDQAGNIVHFETFETTGLQRAKGKLERRAAEMRQKFPGHDVRDTILPEQVGHLVGMPELLLDAIEGNLRLTPMQRKALTQIRHGLSPTASFKNALQSGKVVPGFSMDFRRSFARWGFHVSRHIAKMRNLDALTASLHEAQQVPGLKAAQISRYMAKHYQDTILDARGDFGFFKGAIFLWAMGYVPAAAFQNLSQTSMITFPFLSGKFGNPVKAMKAIVRAMTQMENFYKRGSYEGLTDFEMRSLDYGIKTGRISETQAPELAAISQGAGLLLGQGGTKAQRMWAGLQEKAALMFELAEQFNRRVAWRAAIELAQKDPNAKAVQEAMGKYTMEYNRMLQNGWTAAEARAIVTAIHTVDQTQYVYARYDRPQFMRGRFAGTLFVFKTYMQKTLFMLAHNKGDVLPYYLVMTAMIGGLAGIPGYEDMRDILNAFMKKMLGRDYDLDREVRRYVRDIAGGAIPADLVLHGLARFGLGVPALLDMLGSLATGTPGRGFDPATAGRNVPFGTVDMSRMLSMGNILPVELGKMFTETKDVNSTIAEQTQKASGAVFSVAFNIYKAIMDNQLDAMDPKRYERAIPRVLGMTSRTFRTMLEGRERYRGGVSGAPTFLQYNWKDPEQAMELLGIQLGFQPLRSSYKWNATIAEMEIEKFWELRRTGLLGELYDARKSGDVKRQEAAKQKIQEWNGFLDKIDRARGYKISGPTAERSFKARERVTQAREAGQPTKKMNQPIRQYIEELFPGAIQDVRRVQ